MDWEKELADIKEMNIVNFIEKNADLNKEAIVFEDDKGKIEKLSYKEFFEKVNKFANYLKNKGAKKGDRVAIFLPKIPENYVSIIACVKIGAIAMPLFEAFQADGLELRLERGDTSFLITNNELKERYNKIKNKFLLKVIDISDKEIEKQNNQFQSVLVDRKNTALMMFTSSTAGTPVAGIEIPHQAFIQWIYTAKKVLKLNKKSKYWCTAHPAWVTGAVYGVFAPLLIGCTIYVKEGRFDSKTWINFLEKSYGKKLPDIEVLEYKDKLTKFFSLLIEIDRKSKGRGKENGKKDQ